MDQFHGHHGETPCPFCIDNAGFSGEIGQPYWMEYYLAWAITGTCIHMPDLREAFEVTEQQLPPELRLHASALGNRPSGPSHLTLPHHELDRASDDGARDLSRPMVLPSWPAYRSEYIADAHREPNQRRWTDLGYYDDETSVSANATSDHGSSDNGSSDYGSSHAYEPSSRGISMRGLEGRSEPGMLGLRQSHERHGSSSLEDIDSYPDSFPSPGSESSSSGEGSQARPGMRGRRGSGSWEYTERPGIGGRRGSGTW